MFTLTYRLNDGIVEEIEEHDYEWGLEAVDDGIEYKTVENIPQYNPRREFLRVVGDDVVAEQKELSLEQIREIEKLEAKDEINALKRWFDVYYSQHEQKYRRLETLSLLTDEGNEPHIELINLYNEAEIKRKRIQDLEGIV